VSDIDIAAVDSLKALDPKRPIREADIDKYCLLNFQNMRAVDILAPCSTPIETKPASSILGEWRDSR
jgi:hypothetical protein